MSKLDPTTLTALHARYRFGEAPLPDRTPLRVLSTPALPPDLPALSAIDPGLEQLNAALERQLARVPVAPVDYATGRATQWLLLSPFEVFMEQVLARKLSQIE